MAPCPDLELAALVERWNLWDKCETTRNEVRKLVESEDWETLRDIMGKRLEFGTAGLRGRMGAGFGRMNDLVILQTSQGLLSYLQTQEPLLSTKGVVLGYDGRHNSSRWAALIAGVFLRAKVPVILFRCVVPTPFVPFTVSQRGAAAGVMVTASHNPRWDNGYKVYWGNGAQILGPHDKNIQAMILTNLQPEDGAFDEPDPSNPLLSNPLEEISASYYSKLTCYNDPARNGNLAKPIVYTAMHGVGWPYCLAAWSQAGFPPSKLVPVVEQRDPHPDFPTVEYPNPEEGASALDLAFKTAEGCGARYILANDPDADRLACAERIGNSWKVFNGNEMGALLAWWLVTEYRARHSSSPSLHLLASTVSSKFLNTLAKAEGLIFTETLTGFKHMGNVSYRLKDQGEIVLFAYEEAIGFMCGTAVLDKDGVSALVCMSELITRLEEQGSGLSHKLEEIYHCYGLHTSQNSYYTCHDPELTQRIFARIRSMGDDGTYPGSLAGAKYSVTGVRDLTTGYDSTQKDMKAILPVSASSQMITFWLDCNGSTVVLTLRTSGTEPKIKYYTEMVGLPGDKDKAGQVARLAQVVDDVVRELLQPQENGLQPKSS